MKGFPRKSSHFNAGICDRISTAALRSSSWLSAVFRLKLKINITKSLYIHRTLEILVNYDMTVELHYNLPCQGRQLM